MSGEVIVRETIRSFVERIERLEEEKAAIAEDIKQVYSEAKALGFNTKVMRKVIALRKQDQQEREEEQALLDLYMQALGMTPLERWAAERDVRVSHDADGNPKITIRLPEDGERAEASASTGGTA